jgi:hypothetical protein
MWGNIYPGEREFQLEKPRQRHDTKIEEINYTLFTAAPDTTKIHETITKYRNAGWIYAGRKEHEGFLSIGAHTRLTFYRLK